MPMNFLSCAKVFTKSLQTSVHPHFEVGNACFDLLRRGGFGSASVSHLSEVELMGDNWRLSARPYPESAGLELGPPSA